VRAKVILALALSATPLPVRCLAQEAAPPASASTSALAGHYYLSGVMETGSELLLKPDGTFEWFISYGAMDQFAHGRWLSDGRMVILSADTPDDRPLFAFRDVKPWDAALEQVLLDAKAAAVGEGCSTSAGPLVVEVEPLPPLGDENNAAASAAGTTPEDTQGQETASRCRAVEAKVAASLPAEEWTGGVAVRIFDAAYKQGGKDVSVTLFLADGGREVLTTDRLGLAIRPGTLTSPVTRVALAASYAAGRDVTMSVPATSKGLLSFSIDIAQLVAPAFSTLKLRIDRSDLVPEGLGGRYTRAY
jgi:hypothetical protein